MKRITFLMAAGFFALGAAAQTKSGSVVYERKLNMHKDLPPQMEQMKERIPEFQTSEFTLNYTASQSLYQFQPPKEQPQMPSGDDGGGQMRMRFMMGGPAGDAVTFRDYDKGLTLQSRELGPRTYLITDSLSGLKWKLEDGEKEILGYKVHKASTTITAPMRRFGRMGPGGQGGPGGQNPQRDTTTPVIWPVTVWYAEKIESQAGPEDFFGLPGLILEVDVNNGSQVFTAKSIGETTSAIKAPDKGKRITRREYQELMRSEMQLNRGVRPGGPGGGRNF